MSDARICLLDASKFQQIACHLEHGSNLPPCKYGQAFVNELNRLKAAVEPISDLPLDCTEHLVAKALHSQKDHDHQMSKMNRLTRRLASTRATVFGAQRGIQMDTAPSENEVFSRRSQRP